MGGGLKVRWLLFCLVIGLMAPSSGWGQNPATSAEASPLLKQARSVAEQTNALINDKGRDILVLAKAIKAFAKEGRASWNSNVIYFAREFKHYKVIKIVNSRGIEELKVLDATSIKSYNDESGKKYFQEAMKLHDGDIYVSSLLVSNLTNTQMIQLATPISDIGGLDKAILIFEWQPQSLFDLATNFKVDNNGYVIIVDKDGNYIYHPDAKKILTDNLSSAPAGFQDVAKKMLAGETGEAEYQLGEDRFGIAFAPYPQMDWRVGIIKPLLVAAPQMPKIPPVAAEAPAIAPAAVALPQSARPQKQGEALPQSAGPQKQGEVPPVTPTTVETAAAKTAAPPETTPSAPPQSAGPQKQVEDLPLKQGEALLAPISQTTRKVLDGTLRNQKINSLRVVTKLQVVSPDGVTYQLRVRQLANQVKSDKYEELLANNKKTLLTYNDFDERCFAQTKTEVLAPEFLRQTIVTHQEKATLIKSGENQAITMETQQLKEYQYLVNDELSNLPRQFASLDFDRFGADLLDIKIIEGVPTYVITLELKQNIISKDLTFAKLKIFIQGDYFMPAKLEWYDADGKNNLTISYEEVVINGLFTQNDYDLTLPAGIEVIPYSELRPKLLAAATEREKQKGMIFSEAEVKKLLTATLKKRGETIARGLEAACKKFMNNGKLSELRENVSWASTEAGVTYVMVVDNDGQVMITTQQTPENAAASSLEVTYPLHEGETPLGVIRIGLSTSEIDKTIQETISPAK